MNRDHGNNHALAARQEETHHMMLATLIQIVNGRLPNRKGRWFTLFLPLSRSSTLDDQLDAVRRIGIIGGNDAISFLRALLETESGEHVEGDYNRGAELVTDWTAYINAKGPLQEVLYHKSERYGSMQGIPYQYADHKHPRHEEAVQVIENALLEAEAKVKG